MTPAAVAERKKIPPSALRWAEGQPGCTFSHDYDGKDRYGLWKGDVGLILAVDGHELQEIRRRPQHLLTIQLTVHYRGNQSIEVSRDHLQLEYVSQHQVVHPALDPDQLVTSLQSDSDELSDEFDHDARKHPDQKEEKAARLQAAQKDVTELQEFVTTYSLRQETLDPGNPELSGWLFFSTKDKWIGGWKKQEKFLLRIPLEGQVYEFPFQLGFLGSDLTLRKRP